MSEQLPNPMPEHTSDKQRVEELLYETEQGEEDAITDIREELEAGRTPREILDQLGNEATNIIGPKAVADLEAAVNDDPASQAEAVARDNEKVSWLEILEMLDRGDTDQDILNVFDGYDELERLIGSKSAQMIIEKAKKEKSNG